MRGIMVAATATLFACGSNSSQAGPTSCDPSLVTGTYLVHFTTVSGNCGAIPDSLVVENAMTASASSCTFTTDTASDGNCRHDFVETCNANGLQTNAMGLLIEDSADGSHLHAELTETVTGIGVSCTGTYDVTYTRQ